MKHFLTITLLPALLILISCATSPAHSSINLQLVSQDTTTQTPLPTPTLAALAKITATFPPSPTSLPPTFTPFPTITPFPTATPIILPTAPPTNTPLPTSPTPDLRPTIQGTISYTVRVPILMYHYISVPPADADIYRTDLSVTPDNFEAQMAYLANNSYTTIDLYDLSLAIAGKKDLPPKPVILTFDDGYLDNYENAFPILQEYGHTATIFVVTDFLNQQLPQYMSWQMVVEMANAGIRIEPHSHSHADLRNRDHAFLVKQIQQSQENLVPYIGYLPRYFAYPGGQYDEETINALIDFNFWGAVTTAGGWWHGYDSRYEWTRLRMRNTTTLNNFVWLLDAGQ